MKFASFGIVLVLAYAPAIGAQTPGPGEGGYLLPNGWTITPLGTPIPTSDLISNIVASPDGERMIALTGGFNEHELVVIDAAKEKAIQHIALRSAWMGLAWSRQGDLLYVSGGNTSAAGKKAPIYVFEYSRGKLSKEPVRLLEEEESVPSEKIFWSAVAHHPHKDLLFAANRTAGNVVVFDTQTGAIVKRITTEVNPYDLVFSGDARTLYCSNWASDSVSVIDVDAMAIRSTYAVGDNPNDMVMSKDGRLFVACGNDNSVHVINTLKGRTTEVFNTSLFERSPEGSTPNALALDPENETLYVANADNNNVCVIDIEEEGEGTVLGFLPAGWYPSALAVGLDGKKLFVGNGKGIATSANPGGPHSTVRKKDEKVVTVKNSVRGTVNVVDLEKHKTELRALTEQAYKNSPYNDDLLTQARAHKEGRSVVPRTVGAGSPIKHVLYIIKENRTYDQVFGDLPQGNGDPRLVLFGRDVTPNQHKLAEEFVLLDNLYCDAEVSVDGHAWSNAAYATDFIEKTWPSSYGGKSEAPRTDAATPASGYIWDLAARKGLTYRSYGEYAQRVSEGGEMQGRVPGLAGHVAPNYLNWGARDTENAEEFIREFDEYEKNFDSPDPKKRLPNFMVMGLPEDHTKGTRPGEPTPRAAVASNDYGLGLIIDRVSHSKYWPELAVFVIEDDAQDGPDHVDSRRTTGQVISAYTKRKSVDNTFYTTSSMLRTMELLLGLPPMSQFDAAANPMYASLSDTADLSGYTHVKPSIDLEERNVKTAWGARESLAMDLTEFDRAPMFEMNEILWKSVHGADSEMPVPVHRFAPASLTITAGQD